MSALKLTITVFIAFATCCAIAPSYGWAEPLEPPSTAPPTGASDTMPEGPPPGIDKPPAPEEPVAPAEGPVAPPAPVAPLEDLDLSRAQPGRMPSRDGPSLPAAIGHKKSDLGAMFTHWRVRLEHAITVPEYVGEVVDQYPSAGETLARGEVVTVLMGVAGLPSSAYACVPRVEGMRGHEAVAALKRAGFDVLLRTTTSHDGARGEVLAQAPRPASVAPRNLEVTVVVGLGGLVDAPATLEPPAPLPPPVAPMTPERPVMPPGPPPGADPVAPPVVVPPVEPPVVSPPPVEPLVISPPIAPQPMLPPVVPAPVVRPVVPPARPVVRLGHPTLVSPAHGQSFPRSYGSTFQWIAVGGAKAYQWELQVEARDGSWSQVSTKTVESPRHRPARLEAGRYRWRVRALRGDTFGTWSPFYRLYMYGP